jgi:hypothetical protein
MLALWDAGTPGVVAVPTFGEANLEIEAGTDMDNEHSELDPTPAPACKLVG